MSTAPFPDESDDPGAEVVPLRAEDAETEIGFEEAAAPVYLVADDTAEGKRRAILPENWQPGNIRGTVGQHASLHWHRTRYHGLRLPAYLTRSGAYSVRGAALYVRSVTKWWHWTDGWQLESMAVAKGAMGHGEAMAAHREGKKTRAARGRILAVLAVAVITALISMVVFAPWQAWAVLTATVFVILVRHGRPDDKPIVRAAIIPPRYEPPTPEIISRALASIGIGEINKAMKDGGRITFVSDVHRDGPGWGVQLDLPHGVTATQVLARRESLASGLRRPLSATWPAPVPSEHAGRLELWIGFHDISKAKPPAWPLLKSGEADVFASIPFGTDPRGRPVGVPLFETNWLIGAAPGQGKTAAVRVLTCGAALDPLAELWIHEQAGKGDLKPLAKVCHRYTSGLDDESIGYAAESLAMLRTELDRRSVSMKKVPDAEKPDGKVTRAMAAKRSLRLYPIVATFDEIQNVFMHPQYGDQAKADAAYVMRLGRAYGIILILATQRPDRESMPPAVSGVTTNRFCLKVPDQVANDMILGTGSYKNGYNAAAFRGKTDAGLGWLKADGEPAVCRTYYIDLAAAEKVAARARILRGAAGTLSGYALGEADTETTLDVLADVLAAFGTDAGLHWEVLAARLADRFPDRWTGTTADAISAQVRGFGVGGRLVNDHGTRRQGCRRIDVEAQR